MEFTFNIFNQPVKKEYGYIDLEKTNDKITINFSLRTFNETIRQVEQPKFVYDKIVKTNTKGVYAISSSTEGFHYYNHGFKPTGLIKLVVLYHMHKEKVLPIFTGFFLSEILTKIISYFF